jgi:integration host factor subunit beta
MTRSEFITRLANRYTQLSWADAALAVKILLEAFSATLSRGGCIEIRDFGSFSITHLPQRVGRNPKTGESVNVPAKLIPDFKPGNALRFRVINAANAQRLSAKGST